MKSLNIIELSEFCMVSKVDISRQKHNPFGCLPKTFLRKSNWLNFQISLFGFPEKLVNWSVNQYFSYNSGYKKDKLFDVTKVISFLEKSNKTTCFEIAKEQSFIIWQGVRLIHLVTAHSF